MPHRILIGIIAIVFNMRDLLVLFVFIIAFLTSCEKSNNHDIVNEELLSIVELDSNKLEFLQIKGLLNESLIKPLYLS